MYVCISTHRESMRLSYTEVYPNSILFRSRFDDGASISMIRVTGCDVLSLNSLHTTNHAIKRLLVYASRGKTNWTI